MISNNSPATDQHSPTSDRIPLTTVKIGGAAGVDVETVCADVAALARRGEQFVLVHGGSEQTNQLSEQLGHPPRFITSPSGFTSRYTDRTTLEIFAMATAGKINTLLVERLQHCGVNALGLSGVDGRLMVARHKEAVRSVENGRTRILHGDHTGAIQTVNADLLRLLLAAGYVPVVAPLAISPQGVALNVDADRAAAMVGAALAAETLVLLTAAPGLLRRFPDESTLVETLPSSHLEQALAYAEGRMKKKVLAAQEALRGGVVRVVIADGRRENPVSSALAGRGTAICA